MREAERLGFHSVWAAEAYGSDAATCLAWLAAQTSTAHPPRLGHLPDPGRSAAMTAMTAATLDQLSGGRMLLGIGTSGPQVAEGWQGQRFAKQLQRTREYVAVVRMALDGQRGLRRRDADAAAARRPGQGAEAHDRPRPGADPDLRRGDRAENTTLAAEISDGWLPTLFSPEHVDEFRPLLEDGFARAGGGKGFDNFDIVPTVTAMVSDDRESARDAMRHYVALYVGGMGSRDQNFYNALVRRYGFDDAAHEVQDLYLDGTQGRGRGRPARRADRHLVPRRPRDFVRERIFVHRSAGVGAVDDLADGVDVPAGSRSWQRWPRLTALNVRPSSPTTSTR